MIRVLCVLAFVFTVSVVSETQQTRPTAVTFDRILHSDQEPQNWLNHHGNLEAHRFSGLDQINKSNVKNLRVAFTWAMGGTQGGGKEIITFPFAGLVPL